MLGLMLVAALFSLVPTSTFAASGNSAYLSLPSGKSKPGDTFSVKVEGHVTDYYVWGFPVGIHSASGTISFPANLLAVASYSTSGTTFAESSTITPNNTTGKITYSQSSGPYAAASNQDVHLFTITFKAIAEGTANVTFDSAQYGSGSAMMSKITATTTGGTYTIAAPPAPAPSPTPNPNPTPTTNQSPTKPTTPAPSLSLAPTPTIEESTPPETASEGGLQIEGVTVTATRTENSVSWSLNNALAKPSLQYGTSKGSLTDAGDIPQLSDGSYKYTFSELNPGTLYYFTIKAATSDNLQGATYNSTFTTRGYPVQLVLKQSGLTIPGAKAEINGRSFIANKDGQIITELSDGNFTATITPPNAKKSYSVTFAVKKITPDSSGNFATQRFTLNTTPVSDSENKPTSSLLPTIIGAVGILMGLIAVSIVVIFVIRKQKAQSSQTTDIDTAQLGASYGIVIQDHINNTPQPNLATSYDATGTQPTAQPQYPAVEDQQQVSDSQGESSPLQSENQSSDQAAVAPQAAPQPSSSIPPDIPLPLPPLTDPEMIGQQTDITADSTDSELLSQDLVEVEASGSIENAEPEPSAIYDEVTGELAIIHHHDETPHTQQPHSAETLDSDDPTFLQVSQEEPATASTNNTDNDLLPPTIHHQGAAV